MNSTATKFFFWSNENNEPIHVHVAKGKQSANATKIWLPTESNPVVAHNKSRIPKKDLTRLLKAIALETISLLVGMIILENEEEFS